jgi:hypothetical protein
MTVAISREKIIACVKELNFAAGGGKYNYAEVLIALAELQGKVIVANAKHTVQAREMVNVITDHIEKTITVGLRATEKTLLDS